MILNHLPIIAGSLRGSNSGVGMFASMGLGDRWWPGACHAI